MIINRNWLVGSETVEASFSRKTTQGKWATFLYHLLKLLFPTKSVFFHCFHYEMNGLNGEELTVNVTVNSSFQF